MTDLSDAELGFLADAPESAPLNLADELRRGGTGLLAQAVAELVKASLEGNAVWMIDFLSEMERRAAAVPAGNQAKAPTALDEMRALQEANPIEPTPLAMMMLERDEARVDSRNWQRWCGEQTEALARVEAERDELKRHHNEMIDYILDGKGLPEKEAALETIRTCMEEMAARCDEKDAELRKREAVIEAARELREWYGKVQDRDPGPLYIALAAALSALDQAASEAEVTERAIVVGSTWRDGAGKEHVVSAITYQGPIRTINVGLMSKLEFSWRREFTWVSDPEATESAPREG